MILGVSGSEARSWVLDMDPPSSSSSLFSFSVSWISRTEQFCTTIFFWPFDIWPGDISYITEFLEMVSKENFWSFKLYELSIVPQWHKSCLIRMPSTVTLKSFNFCISFFSLSCQIFIDHLLISSEFVIKLSYVQAVIIYSLEFNSIQSLSIFGGKFSQMTKMHCIMRFNQLWSYQVYKKTYCISITMLLTGNE